MYKIITYDEVYHYYLKDKCYYTCTDVVVMVQLFYGLRF